MFFTFKKRITDCISHMAGFNIFLNIINTQHSTMRKQFDCPQISSVPCHRINKLGTHAQHCDRRGAAAIFANGTYFLDNSRTSSSPLFQNFKQCISYVTFIWCKIAAVTLEYIIRAQPWLINGQLQCSNYKWLLNVSVTQ